MAPGGGAAGAPTRRSATGWRSGGESWGRARHGVRCSTARIEQPRAGEDERAIVPGGARAVLLTGQPLDLARGIPDVRHRRGKRSGRGLSPGTSSPSAWAPGRAARRGRRIRSIDHHAGGLPRP